MSIVACGSNSVRLGWGRSISWGIANVRTAPWRDSFPKQETTPGLQHFFTLLELLTLWSDPLFFDVFRESNISDDFSDCSFSLTEFWAKGTAYLSLYASPLLLPVDGMFPPYQACDLDVILNFSKIYLRTIMAYLAAKQFAR